MAGASIGIEVITLFVEDVQKAKDFYTKIFGLTPIHEDDVSTVIKLDNIMINLLQTAQARQLVEPAGVALSGTGAQFLLTIKVQDIDAVCAGLKQQGITLLNGPIDRPWGRRTAAFADPAGNIWEIAEELRQPS